MGGLLHKPSVGSTTFKNKSNSPLSKHFTIFRTGGKTSTPGSIIGGAPTTERGVISKDELNGGVSFSENDDITRIFAEINFIYAEVSLLALFSCFILKLGFSLSRSFWSSEQILLIMNIFA